LSSAERDVRSSVQCRMRRSPPAASSSSLACSSSCSSPASLALYVHSVGIVPVAARVLQQFAGSVLQRPFSISLFPHFRCFLSSVYAASSPLRPLRPLRPLQRRVRRPSAPPSALSSRSLRSPFALFSICALLTRSVFSRLLASFAGSRGRTAAESRQNSGRRRRHFGGRNAPHYQRPTRGHC